MFLVFVSLLAAAAAAPQYLQQHISHGSPPFYHNHHQRFSDSFFGEDFFDTGKFWSELSTEMRELDNVLSDLYRRFPSSVSSEGIEGNQYKITIPLNGFEEKDIVVKARQGFLMVQAVHKYEETIVKNYVDVRSLPNCVNVVGSWTYDKGVLKIVFPLKDDATTEGTDENDVSVTEAPVFEASTESREELETNMGSNIQDADVGLARGDANEASNERQLQTNEIPNNTVEATTYAVDLKGDVEFIPVRY